MPVNVATVPEIMHSMSGMAPDDNLRQIAEAQVEMTQAVLLTAAASLYSHCLVSDAHGPPR